VRDIVKERCALAGVEGEFSAHSLRAGFVTEAGKQAMSLPETMAMTGHHSVATVMGLLPRREFAQQQGQSHARRRMNLLRIEVCRHRTAQRPLGPLSERFIPLPSSWALHDSRIRRAGAHDRVVMF
jgi:hypothetical protein